MLPNLKPMLITCVSFPLQELSQCNRLTQQDIIRNHFSGSFLIKCLHKYTLYTFAFSMYNAAINIHVNLHSQLGGIWIYKAITHFFFFFFIV